MSRITNLLKAMAACLVALMVPGAFPTACEPEIGKESDMDLEKKTTSERRRLPLNLLNEWEAVNPRVEYPEARLDLLGESIETAGQQQAIKVNLRRSRAADCPCDEYFVIDGLSRVKSMQKLGMTIVEVDLYDSLTVAHALDIVAASQAVEPLNVIEQATLMARMHQEGRNYQYIAKAYGCSTSMVLQREQIYSLLDEIKDLMLREKNPLPIHQALLLVTVKDPDLKLELAHKIAPERGKVMTEAQAKDLVTSATAEPKLLLENQEADPSAEKPDTEELTMSNSGHPTPPKATPVTPKPIKEPGTGTLKNAAMIGVTRHDMVGVMTIEGTWDISRTGLKAVEAKITFGTGLASDIFNQAVLVFDMGTHDMTPFLAVAKADAEAAGADDDLCELVVGAYVSLRLYNESVANREACEPVVDPCKITDIDGDNYVGRDADGYTWECPRSQIELLEPKEAPVLPGLSIGDKVSLRLYNKGLKKKCQAVDPCKISEIDGDDYVVIDSESGTYISHRNEIELLEAGETTKV